MVEKYYGDKIYSFPLQWHVTVRCDQNCKHCYMRDEKFYKQQLENPLSYEEITKIIDKYIEFTDRWNLSRWIYFTGGDPLLREDFFDILKYCKKNKIPTGILGNPFHINEKTVSRLEKLSVLKYQLSIDGMEKIHDELRSRGSFKETLRALKILNESNISTIVMFTISRKNKDDLFDVIDLVVKSGVDGFTFTRLVPIGSGKDFLNDLLSPEEWKNLLLSTIEKYRKYEKNGCKTFLGRNKCCPWVALERDLGLLTPSDLDNEENLFLQRCPVGNHFAILADGTVLACRKLPIEIGKLPEQTFEEILSSEKYKQIVDERCIKKNRQCDIKIRGCPSMAYAITGDIRNPDPDIWC